jgi:hypothetical protein
MEPGGTLPWALVILKDERYASASSTGGWTANVADVWIWRKSLKIVHH